MGVDYECILLKFNSEIIVLLYFRIEYFFYIIIRYNWIEDFKNFEFVKRLYLGYNFDLF